MASSIEDSTPEEVKLRSAVNNFLVIWKLSRERTDTLSVQALHKADRRLHTAYGDISSQHLVDNPSLGDLYRALDDFLLTWDLFGLLPNAESFTPVLEPARLRLQSAFDLKSEPTLLL